MPSEGKEYKTRHLNDLRSKSLDASLYPEFLQQRAIDYRTNAELLHKEAKRAYSLGHITESNKLLKEANQIARQSNEYIEKLRIHNHEASRELRRQSQIDAEKSALEFEKSIRKEEGEPINNCTPVKIIKEKINEIFLELTDYKIFDGYGKLSEHMDKGTIGALLVGFDRLQYDKQEERLTKYKGIIKGIVTKYIDLIDDELSDYFKSTQIPTHSINRSKSFYRSTSTSVKSIFKSVKNAVYSKSGKEVTKKTYEDIIKDIIGKIGYGSYYTNGWEDATTHREVKENFITFCNNLMRDIKDLYNTVVKQTGCPEVLHFGTLHRVGYSTKQAHRASIGGKSRKKNNNRRSRKPKRKTRSKK